MPSVYDKIPTKKTTFSPAWHTSCTSITQTIKCSSTPTVSCNNSNNNKHSHQRDAPHAQFL